jgi:predicted lipoprotein with Yx(FWY)xxD motif
VRTLAPLLVAGAVLAAGCGEDEESPAPERMPAAQMEMEMEREAPAEQRPERPRRRTGTRITLRDSEFGTMLFSPGRQAIYIFQNDPKGRTVCYGECAAAWPPVYTRGEPRAGKGVRASLLGTVRRRDGRRQVTYAGKPLYYYANEEPGEVRCHNVNLNGGLWWVVGPDGRRRA